MSKMKAMDANELYRLLLQNPQAFGFDHSVVQIINGQRTLELRQGRAVGDFYLFQDFPPISEEMGLKIAQIEQFLENVVDDPNNPVRRRPITLAKHCLEKIQEIYRNYSQMKNRLQWFQKNLQRMTMDVLYLDDMLTKQHRMVLESNEINQKACQAFDELLVRYEHLRQLSDSNTLLLHDAHHGDVQLAEGVLMS